MNVEPQHNRAPAVRRGSALIVALWVTGLLAMFVAGFAFDMQIQARITSAWRKKLKAQYLARSGMALVHMALMESLDSDIQSPDKSLYLSKGGDEELRLSAVALANGCPANLTRELDGAEIKIDIRPENAKININSMIKPEDRTLTYQIWTPVFQSIGVPLFDRDALVDCLVDWVDQDEASLLNGAESQYYESLDPPYSANNAPLATIEELMLIKGFDAALPESDKTIYEALRGMFTTYTDDEKININSASVETLIAYFNMNRQIAEDIVAQRAGTDKIPGTDDDRPYTDMADLLARVPVLDPSIEKFITFSAAGRFNVKIEAALEDMVHTIDCILFQDGKKFAVLYWREGDPEPEPDMPF